MTRYRPEANEDGVPSLLLRAVSESEMEEPSEDERLGGVVGSGGGGVVGGDGVVVGDGAELPPTDVPQLVQNLTAAGRTLPQDEHRRST